MKIGTWNGRSLYRAGSFKLAARELARYKLDVVEVQEVRWDKGAQEEQAIVIFFTGNEMNIINLEQVYFYTVE
jgi:exonuclease III